MASKYIFFYDPFTFCSHSRILDLQRWHAGELQELQILVELLEARRLQEVQEGPQGQGLQKLLELQDQQPEFVCISADYIRTYIFIELFLKLHEQGLNAPWTKLYKLVASRNRCDLVLGCCFASILEMANQTTPALNSQHVGICP